MNPLHLRHVSCTVSQLCGALIASLLIAAPQSVAQDMETRCVASIDESVVHLSCSSADSQDFEFDEPLFSAYVFENPSHPLSLLSVRGEEDTRYLYLIDEVGGTSRVINRWRDQGICSWSPEGSFLALGTGDSIGIFHIEEVLRFMRGVNATGFRVEEIAGGYLEIIEWRSPTTFVYRDGCCYPPLCVLADLEQHIVKDLGFNDWQKTNDERRTFCDARLSGRTEPRAIEFNAVID